jgi:hypothetical protein
MWNMAKSVLIKGVIKLSFISQMHTEIGNALACKLEWKVKLVLTSIPAFHTVAIIIYINTVITTYKF